MVWRHRARNNSVIQSIALPPTPRQHVVPAYGCQIGRIDVVYVWQAEETPGKPVDSFLPV